MQHIAVLQTHEAKIDRIKGKIDNIDPIKIIRDGDFISENGVSSPGQMEVWEVSP